MFIERLDCREFASGKVMAALTSHYAFPNVCTERDICSKYMTRQDMDHLQFM